MPDTAAPVTEPALEASLADTADSPERAANSLAGWPSLARRHRVKVDAARALLAEGA